MSNSKAHDRNLQPMADYFSRQCECGPCVLVEPARRFGLKGPIPDVFAWRTARDSFDADWKESEADARAHMLKPHVREPWRGPGAFRYLACREYLIEPTASYLPEWMGLLWLGDEGLYEVREAQRHHRRDMYIEAGMLLTAWQGMVWAQVMPAKAKADGGRAAKLTREQHAEIRNVLADCGALDTLALARLIDGKGKRAGTVSSYIRQDAEAGLIEGIQCAIEHGLARLWLAEQTQEAA